MANQVIRIMGLVVAFAWGVKFFTVVFEHPLGLSLIAFVLAACASGVDCRYRPNVSASTTQPGDDRDFNP